jgi:hypothetical protein
VGAPVGDVLGEAVVEVFQWRMRHFLTFGAAE